MVLKIDVFTSVFCRHSPGTVNLMKRLAPDFKGSLEWNEISIETREGKEKAKAIGVDSVPTIVIDGRIAFIGTPKRDELVQEITKRL